MTKFLQQILKIFLPFAFGLAILWWMYREANWNDFVLAITTEIHWGWMALSLVFGVLPAIFRGLRWRQSLEPLGEKPSKRLCCDAIFISYAASLIIPRVGEVVRCGVLKKHAQTPFSKALGTVVTERVVDSMLMMLIAVIALFSQLPEFMRFSRETGMDLHGMLARFTSTGYIVTFVCILLIFITLTLLLWQLKAFEKGRRFIKQLLDGIMSLKNIENQGLYWVYSIGIWVAYYLHFYLAFYSFDFTSHIGPMAGLLMFSISTFAVLVPTPNGAGPWHFAVKTMLVLWGVAEEPAIIFALVVHTIQTLLVVVCGMGAMVKQYKIKNNK